MLIVATYLGLLGVLSAYGLHRLFILWLYAPSGQTPKARAMSNIPA